MRRSHPSCMAFLRALVELMPRSPSSSRPLTDFGGSWFLVTDSFSDNRPTRTPVRRRVCDFGHPLTVSFDADDRAMPAHARLVTKKARMSQWRSASEPLTRRTSTRGARRASLGHPVSVRAVTNGKKGACSSHEQHDTRRWQFCRRDQPTRRRELRDRPDPEDGSRKIRQCARRARRQVTHRRRGTIADRQHGLRASV
jgi:hypothetical protein